MGCHGWDLIRALQCDAIGCHLTRCRIPESPAATAWGQPEGYQSSAHPLTVNSATLLGAASSLKEGERDQRQPRHRRNA